MFSNTPSMIRKMGSLNIKLGDLVRMNSDSMLNGGGLAIVIAVHKGESLKGMYDVQYLKDGYEVTADDMLDILEVVSS